MQNIYLLVGTITVWSVLTFIVGALLCFAYFATVERRRRTFSTTYHYQTFFAYDLLMKIGNFSKHDFVGITLCSLLAVILVPLGFIELAIRYAWKRWHTTAAPSALA